jgi:hypothetical protein
MVFWIWPLDGSAFLQANIDFSKKPRSALFRPYGSALSNSLRKHSRSLCFCKKADRGFPDLRQMHLPSGSGDHDLHEKEQIGAFSRNLYWLAETQIRRGAKSRKPYPCAARICYLDLPADLQGKICFSIFPVSGSASGQIHLSRICYYHMATVRGVVTSN